MPVAVDVVDGVGQEPLLRMSDVCRRLQSGKVTVRKLMRQGDLRFMRVGRNLRFKREWVEEFIETTGTAKAASGAKRRR